MDINIFAHVAARLTRLGFIGFEHTALTKIIMDSGNDMHIFLDGKVEVGKMPPLTRFDFRKFCKATMLPGYDADKLLDGLFNYIPGGKMVGRGERMLAILSHGQIDMTNDFVTDKNARVEVKCNGRLRGQKGYSKSDARYVRESIVNSLRSFSKISNVRLDDITEGDDNSFNFLNHRNRKRHFFLPEACRRLRVPAEWMCNMYVTAFLEYYSEMTMDEAADLMDVLRKEFNGTDLRVPRVGQSVFVQKLCVFALKYYQRMEGFDYLVFFNRDMMCMMIPADIIRDVSYDELASFLNDEFTIVPPSLSDRAGQASAFGLRLK